MIKARSGTPLIMCRAFGTNNTFYFKEIIINTIEFLMPNDIYFYYRHDLRRVYRENSSL